MCAQAEIERLKADNPGLKLSQLKKRAAAEGVPQAEIDLADDSDDPFSHMAELIIDAAAAKAAA